MNIDDIDALKVEARDAEDPRLRAGRLVRNRTVASAGLRRLQHIHTVAVTGAGAGGLVAALALGVFVRPPSAAALWEFLLFFLLVGMGLTIGYHRHFTHKGYQAGAPFRIVLGILGSMAGQGPIVFWTALHRMHHELSDREGDPHSPNLHGHERRNRWRGLLHGYIGWTVRHAVPNANFYARDLLADPAVMWVNSRYYWWVALGLALPAAICGAATHSWYGALEGFLWGGLVRMFALHNMIWWITSFAHVFGTRDFVSNDLSTNNAWLAIPTLGESWHNTHHAFPRAAILAVRWWQIDISGAVIALLERIGVVWNVCRIKPSDMATRAMRRPDAGELNSARRRDA